jgi:hypothetical protein
VDSALAAVAARTETVHPIQTPPRGPGQPLSHIRRVHRNPRTLGRNPNPLHPRRHHGRHVIPDNGGVEAVKTETVEAEVEVVAVM